ncbi:peptidase M48 Ste24p [Catenulispora acidiphila DSM 44928]|uniref:Peptidase M48 Ste24p n=1 Tax=Catenulispora acidiphila (strain DSM 44928 / JCM 14897 / NBRC 102108 / NRRL B-24433 / ID139908) TaxID=479433 RepID=C7Q261_CATAD|nr:M48 family metallopeptidase [Catenulispora acidiphila]ACU77598.1 peptidase M48 Ste24p [Catenulispora acidiphila DSM 44928]
MADDHDLMAKDEHQKLAAQKRFARRKREKARRRGEALEQRLIQAGDLRPGGVARLAAVCFGLAIHALTLLVFAGAMAALLSGIWPLYLLTILGFGVVWVLRPRLEKRPGADWLRREKAPGLFAILDRISGATGAPTPKYVKVDARFNAATARRGVRHEPVLILGAPLWQILDGDERLALLGHELGHQVNGDTTQGVLVATARRSLHEWRVLLYPSGVGWSGPGVAGLAQLLLPVVLVPFYLMVTGFQTFYGWLQVHVSLRAEFLADDIAAQTASTASVIALMRKLDARPSVEAYVTRTKFGRRTARVTPSLEDATHMWIGLQDYITTIPEHEYIRAARLSELRGTQIDASHPANYLRLRLLKGRPTRGAAVKVTEDEWLGVDRELAPYVTEVGRSMLR